MELKRDAELLPTRLELPESSDWRFTFSFAVSDAGSSVANAFFSKYENKISHLPHSPISSSRTSLPLSHHLPLAVSHHIPRVHSTGSSQDCAFFRSFHNAVHSNFRHQIRLYNL
jgi:hypothetical protein